MLPLLAFVLPQNDVPRGFLPTSETAVFRREASVDDAPNWMVTLRNDELRVESRIAWVERERRENGKRTPRPGGQTFKDGMGTLTWSPGDGVPVDDGWIYGYSAGEFGGGLFWFSNDGRSRRKLSERNTDLVLKTANGIFAVQSLDHLMFWYGRLVAIERKDGRWVERLVTDLHCAPNVVADGSRFVIATREYVSTLETNGTQREIYRPTGSLLRIASMVRRRSGDVWIGSSYGLLRLRPNRGGEYAAQWFVPSPKR